MIILSKIYNKSVSEKYGKYFSSIDELTRPFSIYSLEKGSTIQRKTNVMRPWDVGKVGVPLAWNEQANTISVDHTDTHTLVIGPTGSKKSRLIVMPLVRILGSSGESMIISDPKAEVYNRTASYLRQNGYDIFVLNLRSPMHGHRWNPLSIPYEFYSKGDIDKACEFVNDIAENLLQTDKSNSEPFWDNSAGSFFFGLVLLLFKYCKDYQLTKDYVHMGNVVSVRNALFTGTKGEKNVQLWEYAKEDPIIASSLVGTVETAKETRAGILSTFDQKVRIFSIQPNLLDMLGDSDLDMNVIGRKPTAVFLVVPDEKTGYHGLVSLFIKQSYEYMIFDAQNQAERDGFHVGILSNRVNYVLDEFSSLPTIRDFPAMVTAARSRNIRFTLAIQSKHQLIQRYKDETDTIQTNCNNWIFLTGRELQLLEEISSLCGKTLEDNSQPILSVSDLQRLDKDVGEALILCGRSKPCITRLADIDIYDNNQFERIPVSSRTPQSPPKLEIKLPETEDRIPSNIVLSPSMLSQLFKRENTLNIDEMIKDIDKRIAELEEEEKQMKSKVHAENKDIKEDK
jgi:type IV secretion system protein VirD4